MPLRSVPRYLRAHAGVRAFVAEFMRKKLGLWPEHGDASFEDLLGRGQVTVYGGSSECEEKFLLDEMFGTLLSPCTPLLRKTATSTRPYSAEELRSVLGGQAVIVYQGFCSNKVLAVLEKELIRFLRRFGMEICLNRNDLGHPGNESGLGTMTVFATVFPGLQQLLNVRVLNGSWPVLRMHLVEYLDIVAMHPIQGGDYLPTASLSTIAEDKAAAAAAPRAPPTGIELLEPATVRRRLSTSRYQSYYAFVHRERPASACDRPKTA